MTWDFIKFRIARYNISNVLVINQPLLYCIGFHFLYLQLFQILTIDGWNLIIIMQFRWQFTFFFGHFARHIFRIFFPQYLHIIVIEGSLCLFYGADKRGYHLLAWTISSRLKKIFAEQIFPETPCHFLKTQLVIWNAWIIITFFLAHTNDQVLSASCRLW